MFIDISGKPKVTNLYYPGGALIFLLRHKAVASSQVPDLEGRNKRMELALQNHLDQKGPLGLIWFNPFFRAGATTRFYQAAEGLIQLSFMHDQEWR